MSGRRPLGFLPSPPTTAAAIDPTATSTIVEDEAALRREWEVEFSRFFNYPARTASTPAALRPLNKRKMRSSGGTWMVAVSPALLAVAKTAAPVLTVAVLGTLYEEHYVCSLSLSWPQVSCVPQCPVRGSRVVFASYRDCSGQVQKFAVRFPTSEDAEVFLDFVKESFRDTTDVSTVQNDFVCENPSPSELNASNGIYNRFDENSNCEEPTTLYHRMPALSYHQDQLESFMQPVLAKNIDTLTSGLPRSFTDFLNSCSTDVPQREPSPRTDYASQDQGDMFNPSAREAYTYKQPGSTSDAHLKTQIAKYMSDVNFHEMLSKIEKVIDELGGDLSLDG